MGRTQIPVAGVSRDGAAAPAGLPGDPLAGNAVANPDGRTVLIVANTAGSPRTLTVQFVADVDGQAVLPRTYILPAGAVRYLGPFPHAWYGTVLRLDPQTAEVTVAALRAGTAIPAVPSAGEVAFWLVDSVVNADDTTPGVVSSGTVLTVDTDIAPAGLNGTTVLISV